MMELQTLMMHFLWMRQEAPMKAAIVSALMLTETLKLNHLPMVYWLSVILFGFSGDSLTSGAVSGEANRDSSDAIAGYLTDAEFRVGH